jgi:hypothetical protein
VKGIKLLGLAVVSVLALTAFSSTASAAPGYFMAEKYPATISGIGGSGTFATHWGTVQCAAPTLAGSMTNPAETLTLTATTSKTCSFAAKKCEFSFHPTLEGPGDTFDIGGPTCGTFTVSLSNGCLVTVIAKKGLAALIGGGGSAANISLTATGLENYSTNCSPEGTVFKDGGYSAGLTLKAESGGKEIGLSATPFPASGFSVVGAGAGSAFHSDAYPTIVNGEQTTKIELKTPSSGTLKCTTATFSGSKWPLEVDTSELVLAPATTGCTLAGTSVTVTPHPGCTYNFTITGSSPYVGSLFLCQTEVISKLSNCKVTIPAQVHSGMEYVNAGSGINKTVEAKANLSGIEYQITNGTECPGVPKDGLYSGGTYKGTIKLKAGS